MENIEKLEMIDRMEALTPTLIRMRQDIDDALVLIKSFRISGGASTNRIRREIIIQTVVNYYEIKRADLSSKNRGGDVRRARQVYCALTKEMTDYSFRMIGEAIDRDHSTVMHSCRVMKDSEFVGDALYKQFMEVKSLVEKAFVNV